VNTQRQIKLDNLYAVRETLVHQTDVARGDYERLCKIRDDNVSRDMFHVHRKYQQQQQQQPVKNRSSNSNNENDERLLDGFGTSDLNFPEEFKLLGLMPANNDYDEYDQEDYWREFDETDSSDDGSWSSNASGSEDDEASIDVDYDADADNDEHQRISSDDKDKKSNHGKQSIPDGENKLPLAEDSAEGPTGQSLVDGEQAQNQIITPFQRRKERMQRAKEQKRKELREARRQTMLDELKTSEEELRSKYTTTELVLAQTMLQALEKKAENVEELLENLQDEVWAAEEEDNQSILDESKHELNNDHSTNFSLLDQVLAMILSALPVEPGIGPEKHYQYIKNEHTDIVDQWKNYFGRLPPASSPESGSKSTDDPNTTNKQQDTSSKKALTPQEHRKELGIEENDDEWDAEDSD
jgi:hypothetical protein